MHIEYFLKGTLETNVSCETDTRGKLFIVYLYYAFRF